MVGSSKSGGYVELVLQQPLVENLSRLILLYRLEISNRVSGEFSKMCIRISTKENGQASELLLHYGFEVGPKADCFMNFMPGSSRMRCSTSDDTKGPSFDFEFDNHEIRGRGNNSNVLLVNDIALVINW